MSYRLSAVVGAALLAGCAASAPPAVSPDGPAARALPTAPLAATYALAPVEAVRLPVALRSGPTPATAVPMDHAAMGHTMPAAPPASALRPDVLAPAMDAYLSLHGALADDRLDAADTAAAALAAALVQAGVGADLQSHAVAADAATDLDGLRAAFGRLSPPFIARVERTGLPEGVDLTAFRCGMADAPEDGVWLQATGDLANPYFGTAMRTCGRATGTVGYDAESHDAAGHGTGMQHD